MIGVFFSCQAIEIPDTQDREDKDQDKAPKSPSQTEEQGPVQMDILPFSPVAEVRQHSADPQEDCVDDAMLISPAMPLTQQVTPAVADMAMLEGSGVTPQQPALEFSFDTAISREIASPEAFEPILGAPPPPSSSPFLVSSQAAVTPKTEVIIAPQRTPKVTSKTPTITPAPRSSVVTAKPALTPFRATSCRTTPAGAAAKHTPVASALGASTPAASASKQRPSSATTMAPGATLRTPTAKASATAAVTSVSAVRPASAAPRSSLRVSSSVVPVTSAETKRVSICSPLPASAARALSASRPLVCTPHPKSGKGETPGPEEAMDIDDVSNSPAPTAVAALSPAPPAALTFGVTDVDGMGDGPDAAMLLAAALPPSSRTTAEETVLAEHPPVVAAGAMEEVDVVAASMIMQAATLSPEESMEIDTAHPLSVEAAAEQSVILASVQLGTPGPVIARAPAAITPSFTGGFTATMPKLTFPVSTASYMSGTKSSAMKTAPIAAGVPEAMPASSYKPRVKSMVVGNKGDDRYNSFLSISPLFPSNILAATCFFASSI